MEETYWRTNAVWGGVSADAIEEFVENFKGSQIYSVDKFLMYQTQFETAGKAAIASLLTECENYESLYPQEESGDHPIDHWYQYLWNRLVTEWENFEQNKLSIVTFNYDRSLEQYLFQSAPHTFLGKQREDCKTLVESIPIIHVYGDLGKLGENNAENDSRPYRPFPNDPGTLLRELRLAIGRIRLIGQRTDSDAHLISIHQTLASAERICFLGFGFDEINFNLLEIGKLFDRNRSLRIFGSTKGLKKAEAELAQSQCHGNYNDFSDNFCENFLRTHGVLI